MEHGCEHAEASPIGKCAICGRMVCSDCYHEVFSTMICDLHTDLEDESSWELVGFYSDAASLAERRFVMEESGLISLAVEVDEESVELYVPQEEKDHAYAALMSTAEDTYLCRDCHVQYSQELGVCPVCGVRTVEHGDEESGGEP